MVSFFIDTGFKALQIFVAAFFIGRFIKAEPRWRFFLVFSIPIILVNILSTFAGDYILLVRSTVAVFLQIIIILIFRRIPVAHAIIYYALASVMMFVAELPVDVIARMVFPDFMVLAQVTPSIAIIFNIMYFPLLVAAYGVAYLICSRLFQTEDLQEYRYYVPFLLIMCLEINFPMAVFLTFADWYWLTAVTGITLLLVHSGMLMLLMHTFRQIQRGAAAEAASRQTREALAFQISYYNQIHDHIASIRKIRHDMKNQLQATLLLMEGNQADLAMEQLRETVSFIDQVSYDRYTGNAVADAVISAKKAECRRTDIVFQVEGQLPEDLQISGVDICSIFSNLLDNAMHACEKLPQGAGEILLKIQYQHPQLRIVCKNPAVAGTLGRGSADIGAEHGWGLNILRNIAEQYGGGMELVEEDQKVCVLLWLNAEEKELKQNAERAAVG